MARLSADDRLGQFEVDVVEAHFPLLDPASHLNALLARVPLLGFSVERRRGRLDDAAGEGAGPFQDPAIVCQRIPNRLG
jgi:hypothetical protein